MVAKNTATPPTSSPFPGSLLAGNRFHDDMLSRGMRVSAAAHAVLVIAAILMSVALPRDPIKLSASIRVDLVALPDLKKSDLNKYTPDDINDLNKRLTEAGKGAKKLLENAKKPIPIEEPKPSDDSMSLKKEKPVEKTTKKEELKSAIDRIKAMAAIENEVNSDKPKAKVTAKGNALSKGNSLTGTDAGDMNAYIGKLQSRLRDNWDLPIWLSKQKLVAKVVIFIDGSGFVSKMLVAKSSGNANFDEQCLKTIRKAQPFGPPPEEIRDGGITLGFPL